MTASRAVALLIAMILVPAACMKRATRPPALPQLSDVREYVIPWADAFPSDVVVDSVGRVWFTDRLTHAIGVFDPTTEEFRRYPTATSFTTPYGMLLAPDGGIWFAGSRGRLLGRIDPATSQITEHVLSDAEGGPHLLAWHDGEIWFTLRERNGYGRFDPVTGAAVVYRLERDRPYGIAATPTGIWMTSYGSYRLIEVDPVSGEAHIHDLAAAPYSSGADTAHDQTSGRQRIRPGQTHRLVADARGQLWTTDFARSRVLRYTADGQLRGWESLEPRTEPYGITVTRTGLVVYAEKNMNRVVVLDPVLDERVRARVPTPGGAIRNIVVDERRGRIWLPMSDTGRLGLIELR
jgi:streptogramin lyase